MVDSGFCQKYPISWNSAGAGRKQEPRILLLLAALKKARLTGPVHLAIMI